MNNMLHLRRKVLQSSRKVSALLGVLVLILPGRLKFGKSYSKTKKLIRHSQSGKLDVKNFRDTTLRRVFDRYNQTNFASGLALSYSGLDSLDGVQPFNPALLSRGPEELCPENESLVEICTTSGSSGTPKVFFLGKDRGPIETAFVHHAWSKAGYRHYHARAVLRGIDELGGSTDLFRWDPILRELQISPFKLHDSNLDDIWNEISRRKIKFIHGYPSTIEVLAKWVVQKASKGSTQSRIQGLLLVSEEIHSHQAEIFRRAFPNAQQLSFYGQSEKVAFGFQDDSNPSEYSFSPIYGITELLDQDSKPITTIGKVGNLHSTGLLFKGTVFLRYQIGDVAELVEPASESNNYTLRVKNIKSRWSDAPIIGKDGQNISIAAVNSHASYFVAFSRIQFVQKEKGVLEIHLVPKSRTETLALAVDKLEKLFETKLKGALDVEVLLVDQITTNSRGKSKLFIPLESHIL